MVYMPYNMPFKIMGTFFFQNTLYFMLPLLPVLLLLCGLKSACQSSP
jgi:hypothetical protein